MSIKTEIIDSIIAREGGYVNDPDDAGGETNFGITEKVARKNGYVGRMIDMPRAFAVGVYEKDYWHSVNADRIESLSHALTHKIVDIAVNMGPGRAGKFLQRALNALNNSGSLFGDLVIDGDIGPSTINAVTHYLERREKGVLLTAINCLQGAFYIELAERRPKDERFVYGWIKNRVVL